MKRLISIISGLILAGALAANAQAQKIVVGGKNYTEQLIMASLTSQYLESLGYDVSTRDGMGSAVLRRAQEGGQVDLYWEYTGTSLFVYNNISESLTAEESYQRVKELDAKKGIVWLEPSRANNTYALAMRQDDVVSTGIKTLPDLAKAINDGEKLRFGLDAEFYSRDDGWTPLQKAYGFRVGRREISRMDTGLIYSALRNGDVDVGLVFTTDGRIPAFDFHLLDDTQQFFPAYSMTPVVRQKTLDDNPKLADQLNALSALFDDEVMASLNSGVDVDRKTIEEVARNFLKENGLL